MAFFKNWGYFIIKSTTKGIRPSGSVLGEITAFTGRLIDGVFNTTQHQNKYAYYYKDQDNVRVQEKFSDSQQQGPVAKFLRYPGIVIGTVIGAILGAIVGLISYPFLAAGEELKKAWDNRNNKEHSQDSKKVELATHYRSNPDSNPHSQFFNPTSGFDTEEDSLLREKAAAQQRSQQYSNPTSGSAHLRGAKQHNPDDSQPNSGPITEDNPFRSNSGVSSLNPFK